MKQGYSLKNLFKNFSTRQIIGFSIGGILIIVLSGVLVMMLASGTKTGGGNEESDNNSVVRETFVNDVGQNVTTETRIDEDGNSHVTSYTETGSGKILITETQTDEYGETVMVEKTVDSSESDSLSGGLVLNVDYDEKHTYTLNDYLPLVRYEYLDDGSGTKEYYDIVENSAVEKGVVVTVNGCDEEMNKRDANKYLESLPIQLKEYEIIYRVRACDK